jgi:hypothetical protein
MKGVGNSPDGRWPEKSVAIDDRVTVVYVMASVNSGPKRNLIGQAHNCITFL